MVVIEEGETSWGAYVPDLPGCVAVAETEEEVKHLIQEAIEFHLEDQSVRCPNLFGDLTGQSPAAANSRGVPPRKRHSQTAVDRFNRKRRIRGRRA
jgi:predicted RNase H-like HicB family nuclease